jgi:hypothetical protein
MFESFCLPCTFELGLWLSCGFSGLVCGSMSCFMRPSCCDTVDCWLQTIPWNLVVEARTWFLFLKKIVICMYWSGSSHICCFLDVTAQRKVKRRHSVLRLKNQLHSAVYMASLSSSFALCTPSSRKYRVSGDGYNERITSTKRAYKPCQLFGHHRVFVPALFYYVNKNHVYTIEVHYWLI